MFLLFEDEFGTVNLIVPKAVYDRHRHLARAEPLLTQGIGTSNCGRLAGEPVGYATQALRQQANVEAELSGLQVDHLLLLREEVDEEGCQAGPDENVGYEPVAGTVPAAAAAVGEDNDAARAGRDS